MTDWLKRVSLPAPFDFEAPRSALLTKRVRMTWLVGRLGTRYQLPNLADSAFVIDRVVLHPRVILTNVPLCLQSWHVVDAVVCFELMIRGVLRSLTMNQLHPAPYDDDAAAAAAAAALVSPSLA